MRDIIRIVESESGAERWLASGLLVDNDASVGPADQDWFDLLLGGGELPHGITLRRYNPNAPIYIVRGTNYSAAAVTATLNLLTDEMFPVSLRSRGRGMKTIRTKDALRRELGETYYYHATFASVLPAIRAEGLRPSEHSDWSAHGEDPHLGEWSVGKVFFAPTPDDAHAYAEEKATMVGRNENVVILRAKASALGNVEPDRMGRGGDVFTDHVVPSSALQRLAAGKWVKL